MALVAALAWLAAAVTVDGVVEAQDSRWDGGVIVTRSTVRVDRVTEGALDGQADGAIDGGAPARVIVVHHGGAIDGIGQRVSGEAMLAPGEEVTLDLEPVAGGWRIANGEAGKRVRGGTPFVRTTTASSDPPCPGEPKPLYWNRLGVPVLYDDAYTSEVAADRVRAALDASIATWAAVGCSYLKPRPAGTGPDLRVGYVREGTNQNVITWVSPWPNNPRAYALTFTTFLCDSGRLLDADIAINGEQFLYTDDPTTTARVDIQNTVTHEVGHLLGFDHSADPDSTMFADAPVGESKKRDLTDDDVLGMCTVYGTGDEPDDPDDVPGGCCQTGTGARGVALPALLALLALAPRRRRLSSAPGPASAT